jgi:hypothetical protein
MGERDANCIASFVPLDLLGWAADGRNALHNIWAANVVLDGGQSQGMLVPTGRAIK